jgi:hypothetical protein
MPARDKTEIILHVRRLPLKGPGNGRGAADRRFHLHQSVRRCDRQGGLFRAVLAEQRTHLQPCPGEQGSEAFVLYKCVTTQGDEFRNTEFFRFAGDQVSQIEVYFGANYRDGAFVKAP